MYLFSLRVKEQEHDVSLRGKERKGKMEGEREREREHPRVLLHGYFYNIIRNNFNPLDYLLRNCMRFFWGNAVRVAPPEEEEAWQLVLSFSSKISSHRDLLYGAAFRLPCHSTTTRPDPRQQRSGAHPSIHPSIHPSRSLARSLACSPKRVLSLKPSPPPARYYCCIHT